MIKLQIVKDLFQLFLTDKIDLTILNEAPFSLRHTVIQEGHLLFARSDEDRVNFEVETTWSYLDFKPVQDLYYQMMKQTIRQGR